MGKLRKLASSVPVYPLNMGRNCVCQLNYKDCFCNQKLFIHKIVCLRNRSSILQPVSKISGYFLAHFHGPFIKCGKMVEDSYFSVFFFCILFTSSSKNLESGCLYKLHKLVKKCMTRVCKWFCYP